MSGFDLMTRFTEATFDGRLVFTTAIAKPLQQDILRRGEDENAKGFGHGGPNLACALYVDIENHELVGIDVRLHRFPWGPVPRTPEHLRVFEETAFIDPLLKGGFVEEVVVNALDVLVGLGTSGCRHA